MLTRFEVPGAAVAITYAGKLIVVRGYGLADIQTREPVRPITRFDLASVSKSITAVTTLKLAEEGRLRLDERVFELLGQVRAPLDDCRPQMGAAWTVVFLARFMENLLARKSSA